MRAHRARERSESQQALSMSIDPEDFKPKRERCQRCNRLSVEPRLYAWQPRLCDRCQTEPYCQTCNGAPWSAFDPGGCPDCGGSGRMDTRYLPD